MPRRAPLPASYNAGTRKIVYAALILSIAALIISVAGYNNTKTVYINENKVISPLNNTGQNKTLTPYNINGTLITPLYYLPNYPPINSNKTPGQTLSGINSQLNETDLSIINGASSSYFETAGEMYLSGSISNVGASANKVPLFIVNGKPSVIYLGSITCVFCGENRWAMALALSRFGNFSTLFKGYSALGDADIPTLYWSPATYNASAMDFGSFYSSKYLNFIVFEDTAPITGGFTLQTLPQMQQEVNQTSNIAYIDAFKFILQISNFQGTPYTIWGNNQVSGADAEDFGGTLQNAPSPLNTWTHSQVFSQLATPNGTFAWTEYAAADIYIAMACSSLNNTAPICQLSAIKGIQKANGY